MGGRGVVRCCFDAAVAVAVQSSGWKVRAAATIAVRLPSASSLARWLAGSFEQALGLGKDSHNISKSEV